MHEQILINRIPKYLTIDNVRIETDNGIEEMGNQFVAFVKDAAPTEVIFGEQVKNSEGHNAVFPSPEEAREFVIKSLKRTIYPPDFLYPMEYTKKNLSEIMYKRLAFDINEKGGENVEETIVGVMTECVFTDPDQFLPGRPTIVTISGEVRKPHFLHIISIRRI